MSRSSTVTVRKTPVAASTSASGAAEIHTQTFVIQTAERTDVLDVTERVAGIVRGCGVAEGLVSLFSLHTTCAVLINEFQAALVADIKTFLEGVVLRHAEWRHNDPAQSDCDRINADAHMRAMLLGQSLTLHVSGGELVLGQWQRLLVCELDGPRDRSLRVTVMGVR